MAVTNFDSVSVGTADGLLINNVKVPDRLTVVVPCAAASVDSWAFIAGRAWQVVGIRAVWAVAGGSAAAVSPRKVTDVSAPGATAGATVTELTTAAIDLTATANTVVTPALSVTPANLKLAVGDKIGLDFSGTLTGLVGGLISIDLQAL